MTKNCIFIVQQGECAGLLATYDIVQLTMNIYIHLRSYHNISDMQNKLCKRNQRTQWNRKRKRRCIPLGCLPFTETQKNMR